MNLLGIFHYILAGLTALFACFPILYIVMGILILTGAMPMNGPHGAPPDPAGAKIAGIFFIVVGGCLILAGWTMALLMLLAANRLRKHRSHTFCMVIGGIECLAFPLGTILGVFTLVVLSNNEVKAYFRQTTDPLSDPQPWQ